MNGIKDREQVLAILKDLMDHGYRYVVRDAGSEYLSCFTLRPKKYRDTGWGYVNADDPGAKMVYPVRNIDITEINHTNLSAVLIKVLLEG